MLDRETEGTWESLLSTGAEEGQSEASVAAPARRRSPGARSVVNGGLTPGQRMILALFLFLDVAFVGFLFMLMLGVMALP